MQVGVLVRALPVLVALALVRVLVPVLVELALVARLLLDVVLVLLGLHVCARSSLL